jgi:hypothetical protein
MRAKLPAEIRSDLIKRTYEAKKREREEENRKLREKENVSNQSETLKK